jgi:hypothetical protein
MTQIQFGFTMPTEQLDKTQQMTFVEDLNRALRLISGHFDSAWIIDLFDRSIREFRALPTQIQGIENNLSIANMDFEEFADPMDEDGVFRGFPED